MTPTCHVLIADDQGDILEALRLLLKPEGFVVETALSPRAVLDAVSTRRFDAALIDLNYARDTTSGLEGLDLLAQLQTRAPELAVVVMTAWASIGLAVEAMRRGAVDFVAKPWDNAQLVATLRASVQRSRSKGEGETPGGGRHELQVARSVQERLLPRQAPGLTTLECAARCEECGPVGGDFYDFLDLGRGGLGLVVADVSGKGVPAAIVMAHLSATIRSLAREARENLVGVTRKVNALLLEATAPQHYVTLFLGVYEEARRSLRYANCGHLPPLLLRADGKAEVLQPTAPAIGLLEAFSAVEGETALDVGDTLLVYSDGVTETLDADGHEFGVDRLLSLFRQHSQEPPELVVTRIMEARRAFGVGGRGDDVTVLVARGREAQGA
jgi:phosphoserine phosphatase RsbU/P